MLTKSTFCLIWTAAAVGAFLGCAGVATAEETTAPAADKSCLAAPAKLADKDVNDFVAAPAKLLSENPAGGLPMSNRVRELAASSDKAFDTIVGLIKTANDGQKSAIAAGLARTVAACATSNPDYASKIQNSVAGLGDAVLIAAFAQATNDIKVAAVAPGASSFAGGGATGADGLSQTSGTNGYKYADSSGNDTTSGTYDIGGPNAVDAKGRLRTTIISSASATGG